MPSDLPPPPISSSSPRSRIAVVWACVARDAVVLAESHPRQEGLPDEARAAVRGLLDKEPSLGWDSSSSSSTLSSANAGTNGVRNGNLPEDHQYKGLRLPLYEASKEKSDNTVRIWTFSCVYNPVIVPKRRAQAFLEKVAMITEFFRESEAWRTGGDHSCQDEFGQIVQQRMEEVADPCRLAMADEGLEFSAQIIKANRVVLNGVRMQETGHGLDESSSSSSSATCKQENRDPTNPGEASSSSYLGLFKSLGGSSKPLLRQQASKDRIPVPQQQQRKSLRFVASSVKVREVAAERSAAHETDRLSSLEERNELPTLHRSRNDSMEDFFQALERDACMPVPHPLPSSKLTLTAEAGGEGRASPVADVDERSGGETGSEPKPEAPSPPRSPGRHRRAGSPATRAETVAILVVMMLSCLLGTLPRSILDLPLVSVGVRAGGEASGDNP